MRIRNTTRLATLAGLLIASLGLLSACGAGCSHDSHTHPTGTSWERAPDYSTTCTCTEGGEVECEDGSTAQTSGGITEG